MGCLPNLSSQVIKSGGKATVFLDLDCEIDFFSCFFEFVNTLPALRTPVVPELVTKYRQYLIKDGSLRLPASAYQSPAAEGARRDQGETGERRPQSARKDHRPPVLEPGQARLPQGCWCMPLVGRMLEDSFLRQCS
jgi:hypothetical protein